MARLAAIQAPYPGSKQIAYKNSNQSIAQPSKHTDAFFSCNCSCWPLSNFVIRDKAWNTLYSKCTSIKGIPCVSPTLTQPLLQDGTYQDSRSQQERRFHPAVWVPRAAVPRSPHPTSSATEPLSHSEELPSSKARHIQASLQHILECFSGALALEFWLPNSFCHEAVCSSPSGRADAGAGGEDRGTRASHPVPCLLESCWHRYTNNW